MNDSKPGHEDHPDKGHLAYEGRNYMRIMDPDLFEKQYEKELERREEAKKRRIEASKK